MSSPLARFTVLLALLAFSSCDERTPGSLGILADDSVDAKATRTASFDFGAVKMETSASRRVWITNIGAGPLTLVSLENVGGDPIRIAGEGKDEAPFDIAFVPGMVIQPGQRYPLDTLFRPGVFTESSHPHSTDLVLRAEDTLASDADVTFTLRGLGLSSDCAVPETLDFGMVAIEDAAQLNLTITNSAPVEVRMTVGTISNESGGQAAFSFAQGTTREFVVPAFASASIPVLFRPFESRTYMASVLVQAADHCAARKVQLLGTGVDSTLVWTPAGVDCGFATPGITVTREVVFENLSRADAELSGIKALNPAEFGTLIGPGGNGSTLLVPARGTASIEVWCKPATLGLRQSMLAFETNLARLPTGNIVARIYGGGPDIDTGPTLAFGKMGYFPSNPNVFQRRKLRVKNVGSPIPELGNAANLLLGQRDPDNNPIPGTIFEIVPRNKITTAEEFSVTLPGSFDVKKGLEAVEGRNAIDLVVQITPKSLGLKEAELWIRSNDPDEGIAKVMLSADVQTLTPCQYTVTPSTGSLAFGLVAQPDVHEMSFVIQNVGTDVCIISGLDLVPTSNPLFTLPAGPIASRELKAKETIEVVVRARARGTLQAQAVTFSGHVEFFASSPTKPSTLVPLSAQVGIPCLMVAPDDAAFGGVSLGCASPNRVFRVYNRCAGTFPRLTSLRIASAPGTDPRCLSASCNFSITSQPVIPSGGASLTYGAAPTTFQVQYSPSALGKISDVLLVGATQNNQNVTYAIPLRGLGAQVNENTDTFSRPQQPQSDVLMVIPTSWQAGPKQLAIGNGFSSFIAYANSDVVDWRLGVASADTANGNAGALVTGVGQTEKVLLPSTTDLANKFKGKVTLGTAGVYENTLEAAYLALSPELISVENAALLRDTTDVAVVAATTWGDYSQRTVSYYLDAFWNLRGHDAKQKFTFNALTPLVACPYPSTANIAQATTSTGGQLEDICPANLSLALSRLGTVAFGRRSTFALTAQPSSAAQISAKLNGFAFPAVSATGSTIWSYDATSNRIVVDSAFLPSPGDTLTLTYPVVCY
jgi:hypothetical protein